MDLHFAPLEHPVWSSSEQIAAINADPGFGTYFTDHMVVATWTAEAGWHDGALLPYGPFRLDPASAVFHYAQEIFEGLKAYGRDDGSVWLFRPEVNAQRFARSARRLALPLLSEAAFVESVEALVRLDARWVPRGEEQSLYLRPFMMANENYLGVRPARTVTYCVIASPVGAYFHGGVRPVDIWVSHDYSRAAPGGTGAAKCGGNYAASLLAQQEAYDHGCSQVLFADALSHEWVEELGGMNLVLVSKAGVLVTPELSGSILEGVTRDSILTVGRDLGLITIERRISLSEIVDGLASGEVTEVFACGTAAVITPIRAFKSGARECAASQPQGEVTMTIRNTLLDIQYGRAADPHGWTHRVC